MFYKASNCYSAQIEGTGVFNFRFMYTCVGLSYLGAFRKPVDKRQKVFRQICNIIGIDIRILQDLAKDRLVRVIMIKVGKVKLIDFVTPMNTPLTPPILKLNHFFFWPYYKRVNRFYHQWTILKSISMLWQNYEHLEFRLKSKDQVISKAIEHEKQLMAEIRSIKLAQINNPDLIRKGNEIFGTQLPDGTEN